LYIYIYMISIVPAVALSQYHFFSSISKAIFFFFTVFYTRPIDEASTTQVKFPFIRHLIRASSNTSNTITQVANATIPEMLCIIDQ
jgi:hypothetical protein